MALTMHGQVVIQAATPGEDPVQIGTLWVDTTGTATLKVCTSISPYTFAAITGGGGGDLGDLDDVTITAAATGDYLRFNGSAWVDVDAAQVLADIEASIDHGSIAGLSDDDHTQYLLASGARAMSGALDMGTNAITNVGNVDGVDVSGHASRHANGGADELSVAGLSGELADVQPPKNTLQTSTATGTQNNFSLSSGRLTTLLCTNASALVLTGATSNGSTPTAGDRLIIHNNGSSTVKVTHNDSGSTAEHRFDCPSAAGQIVGPQGAMTFVYEAGTVNRWHLVAVTTGKPIDVPFSAGNFTGSDSMTVTVQEADQRQFQYLQDGQRLKVMIALSDITLGGTQSTAVLITIPGGFAASASLVSQSGAVHKGVNGGSSILGAQRVIASAATAIRAERQDGANWTLGTNNSDIAFTFEFTID